MKKYFFLMIVATAVLSGCDNKGKILISEDEAEYVVNVLEGNDFFEPVAGTYPVIGKSGVLSTTIAFRVTEKFKYPNYEVTSFYLEPYDKDENCVKQADKCIEFQVEDQQAAFQQLVRASVGDIVNIKFSHKLLDKGQEKKVLETIALCGVTLDVDEPEEHEEEEVEVAKPASSKSSANWDKVLDSYEKYMDNYLALLKKANAGDMAAYSDMPKLLEQCNELNEQLDDASDEMTAAQMARFQKIATKMASAASQF
jgi:hypothetical protein